MNELNIIAVIEAKEEYREDVLQALHAVTDETRKEAGNLSYALHQDVNNPQKFIIIEHWASQEAIDFHNETEHFQAFKNAIDGKVNGLTIDIINRIY